VKRIVALAAGTAVAALALRYVANATKRSRSLAGSVVVVTGGSRGLGLALARAFGERGASVAICGRRSDTLDRAAADLAERGIEVYASPCDVRDRSDVERFVAAVLNRYGRLDVVVNNAGTIAVGPLDA
jgi:NAD(P)-dependent dehydrogenase (short-subunit alcohol dehydrogenase family)